MNLAGGSVMKPPIIPEAIRSDPKLLSAIERASAAMERIARRSADPFALEWSINGEGNGRRIVHLRIADWSGAVDADFTQDELQNADRTDDRLFRRWGDVLQLRCTAELRKLIELVSQLEGD